MVRERTSLSSAGAPPPKKCKISETARDDNKSEEKRCHLLELPAELRNEIYALVCATRNEEVYLHPRSRGRLAHGYTIARVNHQIRGEFLHVLDAKVKRIVAHVKDLDFGHIIRYFNRCDDTELATLRPWDDGDTGSRQMNIVLQINDDSHLFMENLRRWLNRSERLDKKGTNIKIEYRLRTFGGNAGPSMFWVLRKMEEAHEPGRRKDVLNDILALRAA